MKLGKSISNLLHLVTANAILKVIGILSIFIFTRYLTKEELAIIPIYYMLARLSNVIFSFGTQPLIKEVPSLIKSNNLQKAYGMIYSCLLITTPGILLFSLLAYLFSIEISEKILNNQVPIIEWMSIGFFFEGMYSTLLNIFWCTSRFKQKSRIIVVNAVIKLISGIGLVLIWGKYGLLVSLLLTSISGFGLSVYFLKDIFLEKGIRLFSLKSLYVESLPFYIESYLMYFRAEGDQLLVSLFLGPEILAIYYIAKRPFELVNTLVTPLSQILSNSLATLKDVKDQYNLKLNQILTFNFYVLLPTVVIFAGLTPTFINLIAGADYHDSILPAVILLGSIFIQFLWRSSFGRSVFILKSSMSRFYITLFESLVLMMLLYWMGSFWGLLGIVIAKLLTSAISGIFAYYYVKSEIEIRVNPSEVITVFLISSLMGLILLLSNLFFTNYFLLCLGFLLGAIIYLIFIRLTVSGNYYRSINEFLPFKLQDPLNHIFN